MPGPKPLSPYEPLQVGPFSIRGILGRGGQGTVYLGEHPSGQQAAVKVLHLNEGAAKASERIQRELTKLRRVPRHWTAEVLDAGLDGEMPFIATEYIEGKTLQEVVTTEGPLSRASLHRVAFQTIDALTVIHGSRVVHRDFKPANVLRGPDGWVVIDFGIAGIIGVPDTTQVRGTLLYMAPEQFGEASAVDEDAYALDVFAWASTMVFAGTGRLPFRGDSMFEVMRAVVEDEPDLHGLDGPLAEVLRRCFTKDPAARPSATEVHALLRRHDSEPAATTADPTRPAQPAPAQRSPRRRMPGLVVLSAVVLALLVPAAVWAATEISGRKGQPTTGQSSPATSTVPVALPATLQPLVPGWSPTTFIPGTLRVGQAEKWVHHSGGVSVSVVRYESREAFTKEYESVLVLHERSQAADWKSGTAKSAGGLSGRYLEYEVIWEDGTQNTSIWWDDSTANATGYTVVILQSTSSTPRTRALTRLRQLLQTHDFTIPA